MKYGSMGAFLVTNFASIHRAWQKARSLEEFTSSTRHVFAKSRAVSRRARHSFRMQIFAFVSAWRALRSPFGWSIYTLTEIRSYERSRLVRLSWKENDPVLSPNRALVNAMKPSVFWIRLHAEALEGVFGRSVVDEWFTRGRSGC